MLPSLSSGSPTQSKCLSPGTPYLVTSAASGVLHLASRAWSDSQLLCSRPGALQRLQNQRNLSQLALVLEEEATLLHCAGDHAPAPSGPAGTLAMEGPVAAPSSTF